MPVYQGWFLGTDDGSQITILKRRIKMKKTEFQVVNWNGERRNTIQIKGNAGKYFGVHKDQKGKYSITHLSTGRKMTDFDKLKQAKFFIEQTESEKFNVSWEVGNIYMNMAESKMVLKRLSHNIPKAQEIIQIARKI